jgi:glycosyltransferase involved in cell wall biosynthesis
VVLTTDGWLGRELKELTPLFRDKVTTLPLGVVANPPKFDHDESKAKLGVSGRKVALFFGYLAFYKGIDSLVKAAQLLHQWGTNWTIILAGGRPVSDSGPDHENSVFGEPGEPLQIPPNLRLDGFVPEERIPAYMAAADVVVLPYKYLFSSSEPLSLALSYEKPVLLSDQFSVAVRDPRLIVVGNPEKLADGIARSQDDGRLAAAAGNLAREWKAERDWVAISKRYFRICEQIHERSLSKPRSFETTDNFGESG